MRIKLVITAIALIGFTALGIGNITTHNQKLNLKDIQLKSTTADLKQLELKYDHLNIELDKTDKTNQEQLKKLEEEKKNLEAEKQRLESELQAKLEAKRIAAERQNQASTGLFNTVTATQTASAAITGDKSSWMAAAGIPQSEWWAVDSIVSRESGWNPNAVNPSSGACGLGQQLPCGKWAGAWNDPVAALKGQHGYVVARYGGYAQAVAFWNQNHWY